MDINFDDDIPGDLEPLVVKLKGTASPLTFLSVDIWRLADELSDVFDAARKENLRNELELSQRLRVVYEKHSIQLPSYYLLANTVAQVIIHEVSERRKKFERTLWASGDDVPAWGVFTPDLTPDQEPSNDLTE